ncbi:radical SAM protein [Cupriavidus basilensis]|uniref:Radical SAM protein n=1 Tax=Cupriavidus basilensis TaxID=68895 RepID=A0ABT6AUM4_9BURK|nr:radical SAM protein [Cupriavidus basilensis]MDF3836316.1 radical SAM protein [Cupriavidus basilensis]
MSDVSSLHQQRKLAITERLPQLLDGDPELAARFQAVRGFSARVRAAEYHLTNACNIRCKGCWFFEFGHDKSAPEAKALDDWTAFIEAQRKKKVNAALLIGGEPTLFIDRIAAFVERMRYVSISTNGLKAFPNVAPFENVTVFITLFGGGPLDDELRAIKPGGTRFTGLFDTALANYADDPRACFVYAVTEGGLSYIEPTVRRICDNGNTVTFNFYSQYNTGHPLRMQNEQRLLREMLRVRERYPDTVLNHPAHIEAMVTGQAWCGSFGYDTCPSISQDHPDNQARLANGNPGLTFFNTWKADLQTLERCCTSGHCEGCRDSQAVYSWLIVSLAGSLASRETLRTWVEVAESYWRQFIWSPYRSGPRERVAQSGRAADPQPLEMLA